MTPRLAPWTRRQLPDLVARIRATPGDELVYVGRADNWAAGWVCRIYSPGQRPELVAKGEGLTPGLAFTVAVGLLEERAA